MRGGFSRDPNNPKHSFRLFFRQQYGKGKMDYPLFGEGLRRRHLMASICGRHRMRRGPISAARRIRSCAMKYRRATQVEIAPGSRIRYVHVYLNGQYWGLYNTDERPNKGYGEQYFGSEGGGL